MGSTTSEVALDVDGLHGPELAGTWLLSAAAHRTGSMASAVVCGVDGLQGPEVARCWPPLAPDGLQSPEAEQARLHGLRGVAAIGCSAGCRCALPGRQGSEVARGANGHHTPGDGSVRELGPRQRAEIGRAVRSQVVAPWWGRWWGRWWRHGGPSGGAG